MFARGEWKFSDHAINVNADQNISTTLLNGLVPGNSASQRTGNKVDIKSIQGLFYHVVVNGTGTDQSHRRLIVLDRQANGVAPTLAQVLTTADCFGLRNLENRKRFKILSDKQIILDASGESGSKKYQKLYIKFRRPITVEFNNGVAGTIADIVSNSLYLFVYGTNAAGATAGQCLGAVRIRYVDL